MNIRVIGASKYEQKQQQVAATVSIITRKDIRTYGWRTLNEALASMRDDALAELDLRKEVLA